MNMTPTEDEEQYHNVSEKSKNSATTELFEFQASENDVVGESAGSSQSIYSAEEVNPEMDTNTNQTQHLNNNNNNNENNNDNQNRNNNSENNSNENNVTYQQSQQQHHHSIILNIENDELISSVTTNNININNNNLNSNVGNCSTAEKYEEKNQNVASDYRDISNEETFAGDGHFPNCHQIHMISQDERNSNTTPTSLSLTTTSPTSPSASSSNSSASPSENSSPVYDRIANVASKNIVPANHHSMAAISSTTTSTATTNSILTASTAAITAITPTTNAVHLSPPAWIPDQKAPRCMSCNAGFTAFRRRHHCRNCGGVFCGVCSNTTAPLPKYGLMKAVRVCRGCYAHELNNSNNTTTMSTTGQVNTVGVMVAGSDRRVHNSQDVVTNPLSRLGLRRFSTMATTARTPQD